MPAGQTQYSQFGVYTLVDSNGNVAGGSAGSPTYTQSQSTPLPAGTDRSNTATTTSQALIPANANRRALNIQNVGANNIGVNEFGGTATIGSAGTYTLVPGASMNVRTSNAISFVAATGNTPFTATES
jgi:hypothetical protein